VNKTKATPSLNKLSPATIVERRDGTGTSLKTAITQTLSVTAKITLASNAGIQNKPKPNFQSIAVIPEEISTPGPASSKIGFTVLRKRLISLLIAASNPKIGINRFKIKDGSRPIRRGNSSVIAKPANTKPVT
jgi:hypothetical protein